MEKSVKLPERDIRLGEERLRWLFLLRRRERWDWEEWESHVTDMQAATSHVQRGEVSEEAMKRMRMVWKRWKK